MDLQLKLYQSSCLYVCNVEELARDCTGRWSTAINNIQHLQRAAGCTHVNKWAISVNKCSRTLNKKEHYFLHRILIVILLCGNLHQDAMPRYLWEARNPVAMSWGWYNRSACAFLFRAGATFPLSYPHLTTVWGGTAANWIALNGNCSCSKLYKKRKEKKTERGTNHFLQHIIKCKGN